MNKLNVFDPKIFLKGEKARGLLCSMISGSISNSLNGISIKTGILKPATSTFIWLFVFGGILTYILDIVIAKDKFYMVYKDKKNVISHIPYNDYMKRIKWLLDSFKKKYFFRYIITLLLDSMIGITIIEYVISYSDKHNILNSEKVLPFRDMFIGGSVASFTFILYLNQLRFDWAYKNKENPLLNTMILMWFTILIVIFLRTKITLEFFNNNKEKFKNKMNRFKNEFKNNKNKFNK